LNGDGEISYNELMAAVTGELNPIRREIVIKAFNKLDRDGSGVIDMRDIEGVYNSKQHPDVKAGRKTE
jgi:Ca2+-binding EF-hand superfamily protein